MLRDLGSRDTEFKDATKYVRDELLKVAQVDSENWICVPMQGSGSFAVEAVLQTAVPRQNGKVKKCFSFILFFQILDFSIGFDFGQWSVWKTDGENVRSYWH